MSKELVVSSSAHETRLAILENDQLVEIYIERETQQGLAGSIHKGRVTRVLPGMQSAFVDIGLERDAFLYVSDFFQEAEDLEAAPGESPARTPPAKTRPSESPIAAPSQSNGAPEQPQGEGGESRSRRERRGRRGRRGRRRPQGRGGFPDAKFARLDENAPKPPLETAAQVEEPPRVEVSPEREPTETEFMVLPGESLAKYRDQEPPSDESDSAAESAEDTENPGANLGSGIAEPRDERPWERAESRGTETQPTQSKQAWGFGTRIRTMLGLDDTRPATPSESVLDAGERELRPGGYEEIPPFAGNEAEPQDEPATPFDAAQSNQPNDWDEAPDSPESGERSLFTGGLDEDERAEVEALSDQAASLSADGHPSPGLPRSNFAESVLFSGDAEEGAPAEDAAAPEAQPGEGEQPEQARLRSPQRSSRYLQRRGRRGRRRSGRPRGEQSEQRDVKEEAPPASERPAEATASPSGQLSISDLLSKGREILVQIAKEPLGRKGARITSYIALPGRYLVYMPTVEHVGVSRKIASDGERSRLRSIVQTHRTGMPGGFIVRTAGEGASEEEVRGDMLFLYNLWLDIREKAEKRGSVGLIHQDLDIVERILRDQFSEEFKNIWVDGEEEYERILRFVERFQPQLLSRVKLYTRSKPIFDEFNVTQEIEKALRPKVWLKSGGYIVINQTEALVAIDVNTGKYVGKSDRLEDTIVNTNLEAVKEIVRQVRLRDLGGIIVVDFIDMDDRKNRQRVMVALDQELRTDSAPSKALQFNDFGLVAITRKRVKQSLERALCSPCPYCHGSGNVKSVQTVTHEILEEARKVATTIEERQKDMTLRVNPEIARFLKARDNTYLQEIEDILRTHVLVRSDQSLHREHFDIN